MVYQDPWLPDPWKPDHEIRGTTAVSGHASFSLPRTTFPEPHQPLLCLATCVNHACRPLLTVEFSMFTRDDVSELPTFCSALNLTLSSALQPDVKFGEMGWGFPLL
ncbi:hypothetical protein PVAP13_2KG001700 [Panicum virgatum]|uniref:Uncharacterized protein n=1 Tax=Panicum virgatum TaxID=38727 RepID=A0A8T0VX32_PANVG|nr:hypothetical protein PVAP13_2KG001700 [Panicum virgatum]